VHLVFGNKDKRSHGRMWHAVELIHREGPDWLLEVDLDRPLPVRDHDKSVLIKFAVCAGSGYSHRFLLPRTGHGSSGRIPEFRVNILIRLIHQNNSPRWSRWS